MNRDLLLVSTSLFIWGIGEGMFLFFQPLYMKELGADPLRIGAILGGYGAAMAVVQIPFGYLSDRVGRRQFLWFSWGLGVVAAMIMAAAETLPAFVLGLLTYGFTYSVMSPMNSYITAARGDWPVGRAIMLSSASFNLGMVFGPLLGGHIAEGYGLRSIFTTSIFIFAAATVVILFIRSQPVELAPLHDRHSHFIRSPHFYAYLSAVFLAVFATYLAQPLSQNYLSEIKGVGLREIGWLTAFAGLGVAGINLLMSQFSEKLGFLIAQAAVGGFAFLLWQGDALPWYALGYFLMGGFKTTRSLAVAQTRAMIPAGQMGLVYGLTESVGSLATILAPVVAGFIYASNPAGIYPAAILFISFSVAAGAAFSPAPQSPVSISIPFKELES